MSADNVMSSGGGPPEPPSLMLPPGFSHAIQEQQDRVWQLRCLLDMLCTAVMDGGKPDDEEAAIRGLIEYADGIHEALDLGALTGRAAVIAEEAKEKQP